MNELSVSPVALYWICTPSIVTVPVEPPPLLGVIAPPAWLSVTLWLYGPFAAGSFWSCVAVASVAFVMTYEPGVAVPPAIVETPSAAVLLEVGVVAVKLAGSLTAWNVSWNFVSRS